MTEYLLKLDPKENPEFTNLVEEYNQIMITYDEIMGDLHKLRISMFTYFESKKQLKEIGPRLKKLQDIFLDWSARVKKFCFEPTLRPAHGPESPLTFLHFTAELRDLRNLMETYMIMLKDGYNLRYSEVKGKRDYLIAMTGLVLSLIALWISFD